MLQRRLFVDSTRQPRDSELRPIIMQNRAYLFPFLALFAVASWGLSATTTYAQPRLEPSVDVSIGAALTSPHQRSKTLGAGPYAEAEYAVPLEEFVGLRAFGALLFTFPQTRDVEQCSVVDCDVTAQVLMVGGKGRLSAPVPWVSPFVEAGLGLSFGAVTTQTNVRNIEIGPASATINIPVAVGVALGSMRETELTLTGIFHPEAKQYAVALTITVSVPVEAEHHHHHHDEDRPWWKFF